MTVPLLTVVIPTAGRPDFLPGAIDSALRSGPPGEVEVVVVPNGPDQSWKQTMAPFANVSSVSAHPISKGHANAARNHGMAQATGKYIRFLDDDDELYPEQALRQLLHLDAKDAKASSGSVHLVDETGHTFKIWHQPETQDFVQAMLSWNRTTALTTHVFRRDLVQDCVWSEDIAFGQDTHWMLNLCLRADFDWLRIDDAAGIWRHHRGTRISASRKAGAHYKAAAEYLVDTTRQLQWQGRLTAQRADAASATLWNGIHGAFFMDPPYWARFMQETTRLFPGTYPSIPIYDTRLGRKIPPLVLESAMVPKRWMNHMARQVKRRLGWAPPW